MIVTREFDSAVLAEFIRTMPETELLSLIEDALERDGLIAEHDRCVTQDGFTASRGLEEFLTEARDEIARADAKA